VGERWTQANGLKAIELGLNPTLELEQPRPQPAWRGVDRPYLRNARGHEVGERGGYEHHEFVPGVALPGRVQQPQQRMAVDHVEAGQNHYLGGLGPALDPHIDGVRVRVLPVGPEGLGEPLRPRRRQSLAGIEHKGGGIEQTVSCRDVL
jgi:hypothetical protein